MFSEDDKKIIRNMVRPCKEKEYFAIEMGQLEWFVMEKQNEALDDFKLKLAKEIQSISKDCVTSEELKSYVIRKLHGCG